MAESSPASGPDVPSPFDAITIHTGTLDPLIERAQRVSHPTDVVIAPVKLHRRNVKLRLTAANEPLDAFHFTDHAALAARILDHADKQSQSLDRVDRLALIESILADGGAGAERVRMVVGGEPTANAKVVEQARTAVTAITNFHPDRWDELSTAAESCRTPHDADVQDILDGTLTIKRELIRRRGKAPSDAELVRRATRLLRTTDGDAWAPPTPAVEHLTVVGLSSIPAPLLDLLTVIASQTGVDVHLSLREVTGQFLKHRLPQAIVEQPGRGVLR